MLTFQILIYLFKYIVVTADIPGFFVSTWAGITGYILLLSLFIRSDLSRDFILTLIGCFLWIFQFMQVFKEFPKEPVTALIYCVAGILGLLFVFVALIAYTAEEKKNKR